MATRTTYLDVHVVVTSRVPNDHEDVAIGIAERIADLIEDIRSGHIEEGRGLNIIKRLVVWQDQEQKVVVKKADGINI